MIEPMEIDYIDDESIFFSLDLETSDVLCPVCLELYDRDIYLQIYPLGRTPDDYRTILVCHMCNYQEGE